MVYNALAPQWARSPDNYATMPVTQYASPTKLRAFSGVVLDPTNMIGGSIPGQSWWEQLSIAVMLAPTGAGPAVGTFGVILEDLPYSQVCACQLRGICPMTFAANASLGDLLALSVVAGHEGQVNKSISLEENFGRCLQTVSAGGIALVQLFGSVSIKA